MRFICPGFTLQHLSQVARPVLRNSHITCMSLEMRPGAKLPEKCSLCRSILGRSSATPYSLWATEGLGWFLPVEKLEYHLLIPAPMASSQQQRTGEVTLSSLVYVCAHTTAVRCTSLGREGSCVFILLQSTRSRMFDRRVSQCPAEQCSGPVNITQDHRILAAGRSWDHLVQPRSARAGWPGLYQVEFWVPLRMETLQHLWATYFSV